MGSVPQAGHRDGHYQVGKVSKQRVPSPKLLESFSSLSLSSRNSPFVSNFGVQENLRSPATVQRLPGLPLWQEISAYLGVCRRWLFLPKSAAWVSYGMDRMFLSRAQTSLQEERKPPHCRKFHCSDLSETSLWLCGSCVFVFWFLGFFCLFHFVLREKN